MLALVRTWDRYDVADPRETWQLDALNSRVKVPAMFHVRYIGRPLSEMKKKLNNVSMLRPSVRISAGRR
jgi:hypothetical protein